MKYLLKRLLDLSFAAFVFFTLVFSIVAANASDFTDVKSTDFYSNSVSFLKSEGIVSGYADGSYGYGLNINRAELLKIIVGAKFPGTAGDIMNAHAGASCFKDVPASQWFTKYICYAKEQGWIQGYGDGTFKPAQNITFVEALKITLEVFGVDYPKDPNVWYKGVVEKAAEQNIIPLTVTGFDITLNRAEMADLIARKIKYDEGALTDFLGEQKAEAVVTYESIAQKEDKAAPFIEAVAVDASTGIVETSCKFEFNVIAGVYTNLKCPLANYGLEEDLSFQTLMPMSTYVPGDKGILVGKKIYFAAYKSSDTALVNYLMEYDLSLNTGMVLYEETDAQARKLLPAGVNTANNTFLAGRLAKNFEIPTCWSVWTSGNLSSVKVGQKSDSLTAYTAPVDKVTSEQNKLATCTVN